MNLGSFTMLNGISFAVVVALVPQALLGELAKAVLRFWSGAATVLAPTGLASSMLPVLIAGWRVYGFATSILHVLGSPKVQMANMLSKPVTFLPIISSAAILSGIGGASGISGTSISAGFCISGLMGPLAALNYEGWGWSASDLLIIFLVYIVLPIALGLLFIWLFEKVLHLTKAEYYKLDFT